MKRALLVALKRHGILIAFVLLFAAMATFDEAFRSPKNLLNVARQTSVHGIMAVGMTFVILTGGIDLSVGSLLALSGMICGYLLHAGASVPLAVGATLLAGAAMGLLNGLIITKAKVTPFVVTLGAMSIARGLALLSTDSQPISRFSDSLRYLGAGAIQVGESFSVPVPVILFLVTVAVASVILNRTRLGRYTYAIGGNTSAARLSGIAVGLYTTVAYVICGLTSALGAVVLTARLNSAEPTSGTGYELDVIAAVVIGGTSLMGGRGGVGGTLVGTLLIGIINNAMNLLDISPNYQMVVKGAIIVTAVVLDRLREE